MQLDMEKADWNPKKPYDLRERLFEFGPRVERGSNPYAHAEKHRFSRRRARPVIDESDELIRILATVIRKSEDGS
jgi:hypothetical protein